MKPMPDQRTGYNKTSICVENTAGEHEVNLGIPAGRASLEALYHDMKRCLPKPNVIISSIGAA
jgi:HD superfamily phosphohydrolase YqeK